MVIWNQAGHSASKASSPLGREQSCAWWSHRHESGRHATLDRSAPLRGASRSPPAQYKAPLRCLWRGMFRVVLPVGRYPDGVHAELGQAETLTSKEKLLPMLK